MAWYDPRTENAEILLNAEGQPKTSSLVYFGQGETLVGRVVEDLIQDTSTDKEQRDEVFQRTIASIKRNLLSPPRVALPGGRYVRPVDVAAEVLKKLKGDAEDGYFHEEIKRAVITCPAEFNVLQRQKIEEAGHLAGFREVVLLEEPVAGALAYARAGLDVGEHVLVYDLGGGTFDLAVLDNEDESFHVVLEPRGMERAGGDDFDFALYHHCDVVARETLGRSISLTGAVDLNFLRACRRCKESLTFRKHTMLSNYLVSENGPVLFEHEVDRRTFEELIGEYVETTARLTEEILNQAKARDNEVDTVVLVGGSTRIPLVTRKLKETLPVSPLGFDRKDVAVALGAAYYANVCWQPSMQEARQQETSALSPESRTPLDRYREAAEETSAGGGLNRIAVDRLDERARELGLDRDQIADVENRVFGNTKEALLMKKYQQAVEMVWADENVNSLEVDWLDTLAEELGLGRDEVSRIENLVMGATKEAVFSRQVTVPLTRPETFGLVRILTGHSDQVNSVAFSPDGGFIASGASDGIVGGWNARTGESVGKLAGHTKRISSVAFSPDRRFLASGSCDKSITLWKLPNGEPFHTLDHSDWVFAVAFDLNSRVLASGGADTEIKLWDLSTGELHRSLTGHRHWVLSIVPGPDGESLISGGADKTIRVWNLNEGQACRTLQHSQRLWSVAVSPDGQLVAGGGEDGAVGVWDLESGELARTLTGHWGPVFCVAISPDGQILISGGSDGKIKAWRLRTGELLDTLSGHPGGVGAVAFSPDGQVLASGGCDSTIKIWSRRPGFTEESSGAHSPRPPRTPDSPPDLADA